MLASIRSAVEGIHSRVTGFIDDRRIRTKVGAVYIFMGLIMAIGTGFAYLGMSWILAADGEALDNEMIVTQLREMQTIILQQHINQSDLLLNNDRASIDSFQRQRSAANELLQTLQSASLASENQTKLDEYAASYQAFNENFDKIVATHADHAEALKLNAASDLLLQEMERLSGEVIAALETQSAAARQRAYDLAARTRWMMVVGILAAEVLSFMVVVWIAQRITKSLAQATLAARSVAAGETAGITQLLTTHSQDEAGQMADAFRGMAVYLEEMAGAVTQVAAGDLDVAVQPRSNADTLGTALNQMLTSLRALVGQVINNAGLLSDAAGQLADLSNQASQATSQIASTVESVSRDTNRQSDSISETAASIGQMSLAIDGVAHGAQDQATAVASAAEATGQISTAIHQVVGEARSGAATANQAADKARAGGETVRTTIERMHAIKTRVDVSAQSVKEMGQRSKQIGAIIETIEDIASQTNLLALNAAIEAARAGDHGRGFAVVADEVRKLAERSAAATREIGALVKDIQRSMQGAVQAMDDGAREVDDGVTGARQASQALEEILSSVETLSRQVNAIAATAGQVQGAAETLVSAMDSVSAVVEENTAATEEMAAASNQASGAMEDIAQISDANARAVQQVAQAAGTMHDQMSEVTEAVRKLAVMSQQLQVAAAMFHLDRTGLDAGSGQKSGGSQNDIVGSGLVYRRDFVCEHYGESGWQRILAHFPPDQQRLLEHSLTPTGKYPLAMYARLIGAIKDEFGGNDKGQLARRMAAYVARREATGAYRFILQAGSPADVLSKLPALWHLQVGQGHIQVAEVDEHTRDLSLDSAVEPELCQYSLVGYMEGLVGQYPVQGVSVSHTACLHKGDDACRYRVSWQPQKAKALPKQAALAG